VAGNLLGGDPAGTTHLIAASEPSAVGALSDVRISYTATANQATVSAIMVDIVKDGLRAAGQPQAMITSMVRTPHDQARAMFQNLTNPAHTIAQNTAAQLAIYAPAGDAVINRFTADIQGLTPQQIQQNSTTIRAATEAEINAQGPQNVSKHTADPAKITVVDVAKSSFTATSGALFTASVTPRLSKILNENGVYHLERTL
jgi:hypothetical protein